MAAKRDIYPPKRGMFFGSTQVGGMTNWRRGTSSRLEDKALHPTNEVIRTLDGRRLSNTVPGLAVAHLLQPSEIVKEGSVGYKREIDNR
jgi:hypothetical protein